MRKFGTLQFVKAEVREDAGFDYEQWLLDQAVEQAKRAGGEPIGEPAIEWRQLTEAEVARQIAIQREVLGDPEAMWPWEAGDWEVRIVVPCADAD